MKLSYLTTPYTAFFRLMEYKKWGAGAVPSHPLSLTRVEKAIHNNIVVLLFYC
jgi:hypothetical protein